VVVLGQAQFADGCISFFDLGEFQEIGDVGYKKI
jgi:hypothetical protein